jgi:hypothetical protein
MWESKKMPFIGMYSRSTLSLQLTRGTMSEPKFELGDILYYAVVADGDSEYNIRLEVTNRASVLESGIVSSSSITPNNEKSFTFTSFYEAKELRLITLTVSVIEGSYPKVLVKYQPT